MTHPTTEQLNDPKWWDENAPEGATHLIDGEFTMWTPSGDELIWRKEVWQQQGQRSFSLEDYRSGGIWNVVSRPTSAPCENVSIANRTYHPDPGTEALATWLEPPDGGDRRPERVLVKGYYTHMDGRDQVWFTTQEGEDLVHLMENVLFEPVNTNRLARLIEEHSVLQEWEAVEAAKAITDACDVSFKE